MFYPEKATKKSQELQCPKYLPRLSVAGIWISLLFEENAIFLYAMEQLIRCFEAVRTSHDSFRFNFWLVEKVVGAFFIQSESEVRPQNQSKHNITFDTHMKTALL